MVILIYIYISSFKMNLDVHRGLNTMRIILIILRVINPNSYKLSKACIRALNKGYSSLL